jgi:hypothetical protein
MAAMQSASPSRPQEVTMLTRRLVACACALALAVPAAAGARAGFDPPQTTHHTVYGDTQYDLQNQQDQGSPTGDPADVYVPPTNTTVASKGDTKNDVAPSYADRIGSLSPAQLAAAYGTDQPKVSPVATTHRVVVPAGKGVGGRLVVVNQAHRASGAGSSNDLDGWRLAALVEAGLLAAMVLGSATLITRTRPQHGATA